MMRSIGSYELKTHLSQVLESVENGQSVIVTRHGKPIARILPPELAQRQSVKDAVRGLLAFPRKPLPRGVTIKSLIEQGRR
jgi:prevent-host-death family protein